jgi:hypothetical protein
MLWKRKVAHPTAPGLYNYTLGRTFSNGSESMGFEPRFSLPLFSYKGVGTVAGSLRPLSSPQVYVAQAVPMNGLGGLQAGQFVSAPLVNNDFSPIE